MKSSINNRNSAFKVGFASVIDITGVNTARETKSNKTYTKGGSEWQKVGSYVREGIKSFREG